MRSQPLILLVDDEDDFLEIAAMKLASKGFETATTTDGHEAVMKAELLLPDLILSDIFMAPGPSGFELALELHRNPRTCDIQLVFFTSLRDPWVEIPAEARDAVAAELGKPVFLSKIDDVERLGDRVRKLMEGNKK